MQKTAWVNLTKNVWRFGALLCAAVLLSSSAVIADETTKIVPVPEKAKAEEAPKNWLAFLAYQGGFTPPEYYVLNKTPYIMLFQDGRLVFREDNIKYDAPNRSREMWRETKISPEALKAFIAKVKEIKFLTAQRLPEIAPVPDENGMIEMTRPVICDAATTMLGLNMETGKKAKKPVYAQRVISEYALGAFGEQDKADPYIQASLTLEKMLQALKPKESKRYEPDSIRVNFMNGNSRGFVTLDEGVPIPAWPLADKPDVEGDNIYSGADAKTLIEMLSKNPAVKVGDSVLNAMWTPAIAVPQNLPEKSDVPAAPKHK